MWQYKQTNELYHYGVPGMKWGHRKAEKYVSKANVARGSAKEWDDMANQAKAKGNTKAYAKYKKYAEQDLRDASKYDAQAEHYKQQVQKTSNAVKNYRSKYNDAERASDAADAKWKETRELYKSLGKNAIARALNASRGKSDASKKYNESYNEWEKMQNVADAKWKESKKAYINTGNNVISRILNNAEYDKRRKN